MIKKLFLAVVAITAVYTVVMADAPVGESIDKSQIKYIEIDGSDEGVTRLHAGDVDEIGVVISWKYSFLRPYNRSYSNNPNTNTMIGLNVGDDPSFGKRIDLRFIHAEEGEILPPVLTRFNSTSINSVAVSWKPVTDATGYEMRYIKSHLSQKDDFDWDDEKLFDGVLTFDASTTETVVNNLQYGSSYQFAIRTLGKDGKKSEWSERLPILKENKDFAKAIAARATPKLIKEIDEKTNEGFRVNFNLTYDRNAYPSACADSIESYYMLKDGRFVADKLMIKNYHTQQKTYIDLTDKMLSDGKVTVTGLDQDGHYEIALLNSAFTAESDAMYDIVKVTCNDDLSLDDYLSSLGADYSMFKEWYNNSKEPVFDPTVSFVTGYDISSGDYKARYDSVFVMQNPRFGKNDFRPDDSGNGFTLLLPSDDVIDKAVEAAKSRLDLWGLDREKEALKKWILEATFFKGIISLDDLLSAEHTDFISVFDRQYRTSVQKPNGETIRVNNGVVYPMEKIRIPDNYLIYRLKDEFKYYEDCSETMKEECFKMTNMRNPSTTIKVEAWSPLEGVWPLHENKVLVLSCGEDAEKPFRFDFTPVRKIQKDGVETVVPFLIPPGTYRLAFGSEQNQNLTINASVYVDGVCVAKTDEGLLLDSSTAYHYDRGTTLPNRYPDGYDPAEVRNIGGHSKAGNYDTDGGLLIQNVVIPDVHGDGSPVSIVLRFEGENWNGKSKFILNHWCLRPTADFY